MLEHAPDFEHSCHRTAPADHHGVFRPRGEEHVTGFELQPHVVFGGHLSHQRCQPLPREIRPTIERRFKKLIALFRQRNVLAIPQPLACFDGTIHPGRSQEKPSGLAIAIDIGICSIRLAKKLLAELPTQLAGDGLVREQQFWFLHDGPRDGHSLLLSAREPIGAHECLVRDAHQPESLVRFVDPFLGPPIEQTAKCMPSPGTQATAEHVGQNVPAFDEVELLKHHADLLTHMAELGLGQTGDIDAVEQDLTAGGLVKSVDAPEHRRLARPGESDDRQERPLLHVE